jgi:hypothetical protein
MMVKSPQKFRVLGTFSLTVPADYDPATYLTTFRERNRDQFFGYDESLTDQNFGRPSVILRPGQELGGDICEQIVENTTTPEERLAFSTESGGLLVGAPGTGLVWELKREQLPWGYWYAFYDQPEHLPFFGAYHRVPLLGAGSAGGWFFGLGDFERVWSQVHRFLRFNDKSSA